MSNKDTNRAKNTILGALVADAASVGFHWLYDQNRIREVAPSTPEFRAPTKADYEGVPAFYAHGNKAVGDFSHYGEQAMVMLRSLAENNGCYDKAHYEELFCKHFGYGGEYVGYIDHPTRDTLDNVARAEYEALKRAGEIPFDGDEQTKRMMITKVLANVKKASGVELQNQVRQAVKQTHNDDEMVDYAFKIVDELEAIAGYHGADDEQLPAVAKLPALVAAYIGKSDLQTAVESAVRVTNNNDRAAAFGHTAASIIEAVIQGEEIEAAIETACDHSADPDVTKLVHEALSLRDKSTLSVTSQFGTSCNLAFGVPSVMHNLITSESYTQAIRENIYAGGDSCGRAVLLGAILGAQYGIGGEQGIPEKWIERLTQKNEIEELVEQL